MKDKKHPFENSKAQFILSFNQFQFSLGYDRCTLFNGGNIHNTILHIDSDIIIKVFYYLPVIADLQFIGHDDCKYDNEIQKWCDARIPNLNQESGLGDKK